MVRADSVQAINHVQILDRVNSNIDVATNSPLLPNQVPVHQRGDTIVPVATKTLDTSVVHRAQQIQMQARAKKIAHFVQLDDINSFRLLSVTKKEIQTLKFESNMNILQLICFEEAIKIFEYLTRFLTSDSQTRFDLAKERDSHNGAQAIHLAAAAGNRQIIDELIAKYGAEP
jgi:hypothetical protein